MQCQAVSSQPGAGPWGCRPIGSGLGPEPPALKSKGQLSWEAAASIAPPGQPILIHSWLLNLVLKYELIQDTGFPHWFNGEMGTKH